MLTVKPPAVRDLIASALDKGQSLAEILRRFENSVITYAMEECGGNRIKAANLLGIGVKNLEIRLEDTGIGAHFPVRK